MKIPRNLNGSDLVKLLKKFGYQKINQTGSHIIVRTESNGENTQSIPNHKPLKVGTLDSILGEIADHIGMRKSELMDQLFGKK